MFLSKLYSPKNNNKFLCDIKYKLFLNSRRNCYFWVIKDILKWNIKKVSSVYVMLL